jgi:hypothetical protein
MCQNLDTEIQLAQYKDHFNFVVTTNMESNYAEQAITCDRKVTKLTKRFI